MKSPSARVKTVRRQRRFGMVHRNNESMFAKHANSAGCVVGCTAGLSEMMVGWI